MKNSRIQLLKINQAFTRFILEYQYASKPSLFEEGEDVVLDNQEVITLTKELAEKFNSDANEEFEMNKDENPFIEIEKLEFIESCLMVSTKDNLDEYLFDIAGVLEDIRVELKQLDLIILGVQNIPWLKQDNNYEPVKKALEYLTKSIDKTFDGGFILREKELMEFIPHLFWLIRCNVSLPPFFMSFTQAKTIISLCKNGVLHFEFYDLLERQTILKVLKESKFSEVKECADLIEFDNFEGRNILV